MEDQNPNIKVNPREESRKSKESCVTIIPCPCFTEMELINAGKRLQPKLDQNEAIRRKSLEYAKNFWVI